MGFFCRFGCHQPFPSLVAASLLCLGCTIASPLSPSAKEPNCGWPGHMVSPLEKKKGMAERLYWMTKWMHLKIYPVILLGFIHYRCISWLWYTVLL